MLTRSQVARRLGRSLATVRRLEGRELHPSTDARGTHWFEAEEVAALARYATADGRVSVGDVQFVEASHQSEGALVQLRTHVEELRRLLASSEQREREAVAQSERVVRTAVEVIADLGRVLTDIDTDLADLGVAALESLEVAIGT